MKNQSEKDDLSNRVFGLLFGAIILFAMAIAAGAGRAIARREARRKADVYWTTALTRRHLAYWAVYPDGHKEIQFRVVPIVRESCVKFVDKDGIEIIENEGE